MQMRQPSKALDELLTDLLRWPSKSTVPDGYIQMLIKSATNLDQASRISAVIKQRSFSAETIFAHIEMLQQFKLSSEIPEIVQILLDTNPGNKQAQAVYLDVIGRSDLDKAVAL